MHALRLTTLAILIVPAPLLAQTPPTAASIMAKVAVNQDRAEEARRHYVYIQHAKVVSRKGHTIMCEETTDSRITPTDTASSAELLKLDGRLLKKGKYLTYNAIPAAKPAPGGPPKAASDTNPDSTTITLTDEDEATDSDLVENMRKNLTRDDKSKDGIDARLFPLTSRNQADYTFALSGQEKINNRDVFHITFRPRIKDDFGWKGDAYIDTASFQPVVVRTEMSRKIPFAVRTLLGTNVPGLGFTIVYAPQPDGVWFPVNFGTEFKIHVLFFFSRDITINAENRDFEKTHTDSKILTPGVTQ